MQISSIYSNIIDKFSRIDFLFNTVNVIYAEIRLPENKDKDTHDLGKTILGELIDFMFLREVTKKDCFLLKNPVAFNEFTFYLEIKLDNNRFITIKRAVLNNTKISIKLHDEEKESMIDLPDTDWDFTELPINRAKEFLNSEINLEGINPWDFRKGINYFLRTQGDYNNVFQLSKYIGEYKYWKPYVAQLLGFNGTNIEDKYNLEAKVQFNLDTIKIKEEELTLSKDEKDLTYLLQLRSQEMLNLGNQLEEFDFGPIERKINQELVMEVDTKSSELNKKQYSIQNDIQKIKKSLENGQDFDLNEVEKLFAEVKVYFSDQIKKDYGEIIAFNKEITKDRKKHLKDELKSLELELDKVTNELFYINQKRKQLIGTTQSEDSFDKYKKLHDQLSILKLELRDIQNQIEIVQICNKLRESNENLDIQINELVRLINSQLIKGTERFNNIRENFNKIVKEIIDENGILSVKLNGERNIEFDVRITRQGSLKGSDTGSSYTKICCIAFDLALLLGYLDQNFYRFAYHDGIFEALDDRKKRKLLDLMLETSENFGIQHIITCINSDWPSDEQNSTFKYNFDKIHIAKLLHDEGEQGRLFNMPAW